MTSEKIRNIAVSDFMTTGVKTGIIDCPYCRLTFESKNKIARHIDETHLLNCSP
jgi:Fe-S oxidoreductase